MSFTKIPSIADISESGRCTYEGPKGSQRDRVGQCDRLAYHLLPQGGHCSHHLTDEDIVTVLPRIQAWKQGMEDLYGSVTTMTAGKLPSVSVYIELTEGDPV